MRDHGADGGSLRAHQSTPVSVTTHKSTEVQGMHLQVVIRQIRGEHVIVAASARERLEAVGSDWRVPQPLLALQNVVPLPRRDHRVCADQVAGRVCYVRLPELPVAHLATRNTQQVSLLHQAHLGHKC